MKHDTHPIELPDLVLQLPAGVGEGWSAQDLAQLKRRLQQGIAQQVQRALAHRPAAEFSAADVAQVRAAIEAACLSACTHIPGARR